MAALGIQKTVLGVRMTVLEAHMEGHVEAHMEGHVEAHRTVQVSLYEANRAITLNVDVSWLYNQLHDFTSAQL